MNGPWSSRSSIRTLRLYLAAQFGELKSEIRGMLFPGLGMILEGNCSHDDSHAAKTNPD